MCRKDCGVAAVKINPFEMEFHSGSFPQNKTEHWCAAYYPISSTMKISKPKATVVLIHVD